MLAAFQLKYYDCFDTYHVHEAMFSTFTGDIVRLPFPVIKHSTLSYRMQI